MSTQGTQSPSGKEMKEWRHFLHQHPELAFQEKLTSEFVARKLREFGVDEVHEGLGQTGVVGTIYGRGHSSKNPGRRVGLRADMDALPLEEKNTFSHRSTHAGIMHACGHDGHTAMLLGATKAFCQQRDFPGTVHVIFQPAEEGLGGAKKMIDDGLFLKFPVDAVFGLHNWPVLPLGQVGVRSGPIMAASDFIEFWVKGKGGHAALPHLTIDPIVVAAQLVLALQTLVSRRSDPHEAIVLSITQIKAGTTHNIIPDDVYLQGSCRSLTNETRAFLEENIERIAQGIGHSHGASVEVKYRHGYPPTINSAKEADLVARVAGRLLGKDKVLQDLPPSMGAEDFAFMLEEKPGCYFWLGIGNPERGDCRIHNAHYDFNDEVLETGANLWVEIAREFFLSK